MAGNFDRIISGLWWMDMVKSTKGPKEAYVTRAEALATLKVKPQTLYAYVSRGWIRSVRKVSSRKESLYFRADIEKISLRSTRSEGRLTAAVNTMRWGEPIIPTSLTEITPDGPIFRGKSAVSLVRAGTPFETVAEWLWSGVWLESAPKWRAHEVPEEVLRVFGRRDSVRREHPMWQFSLLTLYVGARRGDMTGAWGPNPIEAARQLIQCMVGCMGMLGPTGSFVVMKEGERVSETLLRALGAPVTPDRIAAVEAILVMLADHELTSSTFAARVAASVGALLHGCVAAALAANSGTELGRLYDRIETFLLENNSPAAFKRTLRDLQERGLEPPGFNHPLYPDGDPRASYLLILAMKQNSKDKNVERILKSLDEIRKQLKMYPRVELAVVVLAKALGLPAHASSGLFTISRTSGWVAHVMEQRTSGYMLRPRAKFVAQS